MHVLQYAKEFLAHRTVSAKLMLLASIPLLAMSYLGANDLWQKQQRAKQMKWLAQLVELAVNIGDLAHELEYERGMATFYIESNGRKFTDRFTAQQGQSNGQIQKLQKFLDTIEIDSEIDIAKIITDLEKLPTKREEIISQKISATDAMKFYSNFIDELSRIDEQIADLSLDSEISHWMLPYVYTVRCKNNIGLEREIFGQAFLSGNLTAEAQRRFFDTIAAKKIYHKLLLASINSEQYEFYRALFDGEAGLKAYAKARKLKDTVISRAQGEALTGDPELWWDAQTEVLNLWRQLEVKLIADLSKAVESMEKAVQTAIWLEILELSIVIIATFLIVRFIAMHITDSLRSAVEVANALAVGKVTAADIDVFLHDEIGKLLIAMKNTAISTSKMSDFASIIAEGDLTAQIEPRSEQDILGHALTKMAKRLRKQIREISEGISVQASASKQIFAAITQLANSAVETSGSISQTTVTMEEIKQTAQMASKKAQHVLKSSHQAAEISQKGRKATEDILVSIDKNSEQMAFIAQSIVELTQQGQAIEEAMATVKDLAEQSNILAVNAAIEAARAGDEGRGIAVIAQEIRNLAEQSKQAVVQVRTILHDFQHAIQSVATMADKGEKAAKTSAVQSRDAQEVIDKLLESIAEAAAEANRISISSEEQLVGMEQIAIAIENIREASDKNNVSTQQLKEAAQSLHNFCERLTKLTGQYKL